MGHRLPYAAASIGFIVSSTAGLQSSRQFESTSVQLKWPPCFPARMATAVGTAPESPHGVSAKAPERPVARPDALFIRTIVGPDFCWIASKASKVPVST